jgi:hypothetical protein
MGPWYRDLGYCVTREFRPSVCDHVPVNSALRKAWESIIIECRVQGRRALAGTMTLLEGVYGQYCASAVRKEGPRQHAALRG